MYFLNANTNAIHKKIELKRIDIKRETYIYLRVVFLV